jgi:hypothetical protein
VARVKREKRLTKREQKALKGTQAAVGTQAHIHADEDEHAHIHCVACGRHINPGELDGQSPTAVHLTCQHGGHFTACTGCAAKARGLLAVHDLTGWPVKQAATWH